MRNIYNLLFVLCITACFTTVNAQCVSGSFICNDTLQVSVDLNCEAQITADIVLEQPNGACSYELVFFDENDNQMNVVNNTLDKNHVGRTLKIKVQEAGVSNANGCWSYLKVEDKIAATITCPEFDSFSCLDSDQSDPGITDIALADRIKDEISRQSGVSDNCNNTADYEISVIRNELQQLICSDTFGAQRIIEYDIIGLDGRVIINCQDTIHFDKFDSDEIDDPMNFTGADALECDGTWRNNRIWDTDTDQEQLDALGVTIYPNFLELFAIAPASFPNVNGRPIVRYDTDLGAFVREGFCNINAAFTDLPPFEICGDSYKLIRTWTIIDWCKQSPPRVINQVIEVKDTKPPQFSLGSIPSQDAGVNTCTMVADLPEPNVTEECNEWTYSIEFKYDGSSNYVAEADYQDIEEGDVITPKVFPLGETMVRYTVKDLCDNSAQTIRNITVSDGQPPIAICDTRTIVKLNNNNRGKIFYPTIDDGSFDNCMNDLTFALSRKDHNLELEATDSSFVKFDAGDIGNDVLVRMDVTDGGGLSNACWTTVEVRSNGGAARACPASISALDFCENFSTFMPEEAGLMAIEISRTSTGCGEGALVVNWIDTTDNVNTILCDQTYTFQVLNTVSLTDLALPQDIQVPECQDITPTEAETAAILNNTTGCSMLGAVYQDVIFTEKIFRNYTILDVCTNQPLMFHTQIIELIPSDLDEMDATQISEVFSCPAPGQEFVMGADGTLELFASQLNAAPGIECIDNLDIRLKRREDTDYTSSITFTCEDLRSVVVFDIDLALFDASGALIQNCETLILIDDRINRACPAESSIIVSGAVYTEQNDAVESVQIDLMSADNTNLNGMSTDVTGGYAFAEVTAEQIQIVMNKADEAINGVSTLDLVLIQQHILGLNTFDSPYKTIAADINNNGSVSAVDLVELRKVILGINENYSNNTSWKFVDASQTFSNVFNPWPINEVLTVDSTGNYDFIGIKIGDVTINAIANSLMAGARSSNSINVGVDNLVIGRGEESSISLSIEGSMNNASAIQMGLDLDINRMELVDILDASGRSLNTEEYFINGSEIRLSHIYNNSQSHVALTLVVKNVSEKNVEVSDILELSDYHSEWYSKDLNIKSIIGIDYMNTVDDAIVSVSPNPFASYSTMTIMSTLAQNTELVIYDMSGREVHVRNVSLQKGRNDFRISSSELSSTSGIYIYHMNIGNKNVKGKLISL